MDLAQLIGNYAFPVVACIGMGWYVKYITDKNYEETKRLNENHTREMIAYKEDITKAIDNNTLALNKLCEKIENNN